MAWTGSSPAEVPQNRSDCNASAGSRFDFSFTAHVYGPFKRIVSLMWQRLPCLRIAVGFSSSTQRRREKSARIIEVEDYVLSIGAFLCAVSVGPVKLFSFSPLIEECDEQDEFSCVLKACIR